MRGRKEVTTGGKVRSKGVRIGAEFKTPNSLLIFLTDGANHFEYTIFIVVKKI